MDFKGAALWMFLALVIIWLVVLISSITTLINRKDYSIPGKIFWGSVICLFPIVGLVIYLVFTRKDRRTTY